MQEQTNQQPTAIEAHLFKMCLAFSSRLNFKSILEIESSNRQKNVKAWRAYDSLSYVLSKEKPMNYFRSQKTINYLNEKLGAFFDEFRELFHDFYCGLLDAAIDISQEE